MCHIFFMISYHSFTICLILFCLQLILHNILTCELKLFLLWKKYVPIVMLVILTATSYSKQSLSQLVALHVVTVGVSISFLMPSIVQLFHTAFCDRTKHQSPQKKSSFAICLLFIFIRLTFVLSLNTILCTRSFFFFIAFFF